MKTADHLEELRKAFAAIEAQAPVAPELDEAPPVRLTPVRKARRPLIVALAAAAVVLLVAVPAALMLRSQPSSVDPGSLVGNPGEEVVQTPTEESATIAPGDHAIDGVDVRRVAVLVEGVRSGIPAVAVLDDGFLAAVDDGVVTSMWRGSADGARWEQVGSIVTGDTVVSMAARGQTVLAVGAADGSRSRVYRSTDAGATWQFFELPAPSGVGRVVPQLVVATLDELVVGGIATASSFDTETEVAMWRTVDGIEWEVETVDHIVGGFGYVEDIVAVSDTMVLLYGGTDGMPYAVESSGDTWRQVAIGATPGSALTTPAEDATGFGLVYVGSSGGQEGELQTWWRRWDGSDSGPVVTIVRGADGVWQAKDVLGDAPTAIQGLGDNFVGMSTSNVLGSYAGVAWHELARLDATVLDHVLAIDDRTLLVTGSEITADRRRSNAALWLITLDGTVQELLDIAGVG